MVGSIGTARCSSCSSKCGRFQQLLSASPPKVAWIPLLGYGTSFSLPAALYAFLQHMRDLQPPSFYGFPASFWLSFALLFAALQQGGEWAVMSVHQVHVHWLVGFKHVRTGGGNGLMVGVIVVMWLD